MPGAAYDIRVAIVVDGRRIGILRLAGAAVVMSVALGSSSCADADPPPRRDRGGPRRVFFGWKNCYAKDHPMLGPRQTMARIPKPVMISYQ
jgi:hypothetical protein